MATSGTRGLGRTHQTARCPGRSEGEPGTSQLSPAGWLGASASQVVPVMLTKAPGSRWSPLAHLQLCQDISQHLLQGPWLQRRAGEAGGTRGPSPRQWLLENTEPLQGAHPEPPSQAQSVLARGPGAPAAGASRSPAGSPCSPRSPFTGLLCAWPRCRPGWGAASPLPLITLDPASLSRPPTFPEHFLAVIRTVYKI